MAFLLEVKEVTHVQRVCSQYDQFLFECSFLMLSERVGEFLCVSSLERVSCKSRFYMSLLSDPGMKT